MTDSLRDFLSDRTKKTMAKSVGTDVHLKMQRIVLDENHEKGDPNLISKIKSKTGLFVFFSSKSRTEVPIAGKLGGRFVSRRIDRMLIDDIKKEITFIDYKTDTNKTTFREKYMFQMKEYKELLKQIYPDYSVSGYILWLCDFDFEKI